MFIDAITKKSTNPREPMTKVVTDTRAVTYVNYKYDEETGEKVRIVSQGSEIVREIAVGPEGLKVLESFKE